MNITAAIQALRAAHVRLFPPVAPHPPSLETPINAATIAAMLKETPCSTIH